MQIEGRPDNRMEMGLYVDVPSSSQVLPYFALGMILMAVGMALLVFKPRSHILGLSFLCAGASVIGILGSPVQAIALFWGSMMFVVAAVLKHLPRRRRRAA